MSENEKIKSIVETTFPYKHYHMDGYVITTDRQEIKIGISNGQGCCEDWGYLISQDDIADFIGADLLSINAVDEALTVNSVPQKGWSLDSGMIFLNVETSKGTFQITVYNTHNGYYGHAVTIESTQYTEHTSL